MDLGKTLQIEKICMARATDSAGLRISATRIFPDNDSAGFAVE